MTAHVWIQTEKSIFSSLLSSFTPMTRGKKNIHGKVVQREGGNRVMEVIYNQNDKQLQSRQRQRQRMRERNARRQLEKGGLGDEAEIGEGLWATGSLFLPSASGWSSLSRGSVEGGLCYEPDPETSETATAVAPRSKLIPGVGNFKKGTGDNDGADGVNDDRLCTETQSPFLFYNVFPTVTGMNIWVNGQYKKIKC